MMGQAVLLLFVVRRLELSPDQIGVILTVGSVGFLVGALVAERIPRRLGVRPTLILAGLMIGLGAVFIPLATAANAAPMLVLYGLIASFGGVIYNVNARSLIQTITPDRKLGRTIATMRFIVWGTIRSDRSWEDSSEATSGCAHPVDSGGRTAGGGSSRLSSLRFVVCRGSPTRRTCDRWIRCYSLEPHSDPSDGRRRPMTAFVRAGVIASRSGLGSAIRP